MAPSLKKPTTEEEVDALIYELEDLSALYKQIAARRKEIREVLSEGRHHGSDKDIRVSPATRGSTFDMSLLKIYVTSAVLDKCRRGVTRSGTVTVVNKLKPKKQKEAA